MATVNDIDTQALVEKYLQRQVITPSTDNEADTAEEIQALLETIATTFLLAPQTALPLILRAKNNLRQIVQNDIDTVDFLINAIADIRNPDAAIEDTSDLIEAQTALVELDRLQRVGDDLQAFQRYKNAINRFMDDQLAFFLKRNARKEFERSGVEAREDIFGVLPQFGATHRVMADRLADLQNAVSDFQSVGLTRIVSVRTLQDVRDSLSEIRSLLEQDDISKTVVAVELLAGVASLESISENVGIYDPTVSTEEGLPVQREIYLRPEQVAATALSSKGPWDASGADRIFSLKLNPFSASPTSFALELPDTGVEDTSNDAAVYITSSEDVAAATYEIPANGTLFVQILGAATEEQEISITSGTRTVAQVLSDLNAGLTDAAAIAFKGGDRFLIYGTDPAVTSIVVRAGGSGAGGTYNSDPSVHGVLGFETNQSSLEKGFFDAESLRDALEGRLPGAFLSVEGEYLRITSDDSDPRTSSLEFDETVANDVQGVFGFTGTAESSPSYMELVEDGSALFPTDIGVFIDSSVTSVEDTISGSDVRSLNNEPITAVVGTQLYFAQSPLPRGGELSTTIDAPDVLAVQQLTQSLRTYVGSFEEDFQDLQLALSPILSSPTQAQVNDALRVLNKIRDKLTDSVDGGLLEALDAVVVRLDRSPFSSQAETVIRSLEERGLDRAYELMSTGRFSAFFALTKNSASKSARLLQAMESFASSDLPMSFNEEDIEDGQPTRGTNPDEDVLDAVELAGEDTSLVEDE